MMCCVASCHEMKSQNYFWVYYWKQLYFPPVSFKFSAEQNLFRKGLWFRMRKNQKYFFPCPYLPKLMFWFLILFWGFLLVFGVFFLYLDLPEFWTSLVCLNLATNLTPADYLSSASIVLNLKQSWIWQKKIFKL